MVVTEHLASFGNSPTLSEISLSLVFSFFSLVAGILINSRSCGLKVEQGVNVVSRGVCETQTREFSGD